MRLGRLVSVVLFQFMITGSWGSGAKSLAEPFLLCPSLCECSLKTVYALTYYSSSWSLLGLWVALILHSTLVCTPAPAYGRVLNSLQPPFMTDWLYKLLHNLQQLQPAMLPSSMIVIIPLFHWRQTRLSMKSLQILLAFKNGGFISPIYYIPTQTTRLWMTTVACCLCTHRLVQPMYHYKFSICVSTPLRAEGISGQLLGTAYPYSSEHRLYSHCESFTVSLCTCPYFSISVLNISITLQFCRLAQWELDEQVGVAALCWGMHQLILDFDLLICVCLLPSISPDCWLQQFAMSLHHYWQFHLCSNWQQPGCSPA